MSAGPFIRRGAGALLAALALAALWGTAPREAVYKSPIQLVPSPDGRWLYVLCEESGEVLVVEVEEGAVRAAIPVGRRPFDAVLSPDGRRLYVSDRGDDEVAVVDLERRIVSGRVAVGDSPHGVALDRSGRFLYVANMAGDDLSVVDTGTRREIGRLWAGHAPFELAPSPDGTRLFASSQLSSPVAFQTPPELELSVVDAATRRVVERRTLKGAVLGQGLAVSPDGRFVVQVAARPKNLVPETQIYQGWMATYGFALVETRTGGGAAFLLLDEPDRYFADPFAAAFSPDGRWLYISSSAVDAVSVVDMERVRALLKVREGRIGLDARQRRRIARHLGLSTQYTVARIPTGPNPKGLAVSPDGRRLFVAERLNDAVAVIDAARREVVGRIELGGPHRIRAIRRGARLFNSSAISFQRQLSCNTCHPEMHVDGLSYDIAIDGLGRNLVDNLSLRGLEGTAPFKWSGINPTLARQEGPRAAQLFFRSHGFEPEEREALVQFIRSIPRPENRFAGAELNEFQRRGKALFERAYTRDGRYIPVANRCKTCHPPPLYTDRRKHNVGSRAHHDLKSEFDTPHLANLYESAPYMHDGRCYSLEEIWTVFSPDDTHGVTSDLNKAQLNDLISYILTF